MALLYRLKAVQSNKNNVNGIFSILTNWAHFLKAKAIHHFKLLLTKCFTKFGLKRVRVIGG